MDTVDQQLHAVTAWCRQFGAPRKVPRDQQLPFLAWLDSLRWGFCLHLGVNLSDLLPVLALDNDLKLMRMLDLGLVHHDAEGESYAKLGRIFRPHNLRDPTS